MDSNQGDMLGALFSIPMIDQDIKNMKPSAILIGLLNPYENKSHFEALKEPKFPAEVEVLEFVVSKAFNQRRKMLRGALKGYFQNVEEGLLSIGVLPTKRAEDITVQEYCAMSQILIRK